MLNHICHVYELLCATCYQWQLVCFLFHFELVAGNLDLDDQRRNGNKEKRVEGGKKERKTQRKLRKQRANFSFPRKRCHPNSLDGHSVSLSIKCLRPKNEPPKQIGNADQLFVEYQTNDLSHAKLKWKSVWFLRWFIMTRRLKIRCEVILIWNVAISSNVVMIVMKYYLQFHCWHFCRSVAGSKSRNLIR